MRTLTASDAAKAVVRRNTEEVQGEGNFDVFEELFSDDFVDHTPQPNMTPDKAGVRKLYGYIREAFPDFHAQIPLATRRWRPSDDIQNVLWDARRTSSGRRSNSPQNSLRDCRCDARSQRQDHRPLGCGESFLADPAARSLKPLMRVSGTKMKRNK